MTVFFDIDDTLYDRGLPFMEAAGDYFNGKVADLREAYRLCEIRGNEVFLPSQRSEISMDEMYIYRWGRGFADVGIEITSEEALEFQHLYCIKKKNIALSMILEDLLRYCSEHADGLGVITNGPSVNQRSKVKSLDLERFMENNMIIISGEAGVDKPDAAIFRLAENISGKNPGELLYVGDSLTKDIYPASACGWHAIWFNRDLKPLPEDLHIDAVVNTEDELAVKVKEMISSVQTRNE